MLFKGGTSLSKAYGAIRRFSEDIDLWFDRAELGYIGDRDPERDGISRTGRQACRGARRRCRNARRREAAARAARSNRRTSRRADEGRMVP
ncbi:nucleotidyl transferase AbiEii/AbiGii toxin family protein [Mesorhizobium sp. M0317]|uniref:Nucleotidyl transferase AbiEii/AbiGii toxin family protein n=1 Tax=Mesorhizobium caraganae TaxID=483206 RepID=A0ABV1Z794_9HYPH